MMQDVAGVLDAAADLLTPEGAWTQGAHARNSNGQMVLTFGETAVCWCLRGAMVRTGAVHLVSDSSPATQALGFSTAAKMVAWNDHPSRTQAEVVAKLREAAAIARATTASKEGE